MRFALNMSAIQTFSFRHQALLTSLLNNRAGLSVDQLAKELGISRNATNQHLSGLTNLGLIEHSLRPSSGGRPVNSPSGWIPSCSKCCRVEGSPPALWSPMWLLASDRYRRSGTTAYSWRNSRR